MPSYLYRVGYTSQAWAALAKSPQNRVEAVRPVVEGLGGKVTSAFFTFGKDDIILICEMPDNASAAAFSIAATAGGSVSHVHTTPLMTIDEGMSAMKKAAGTSYRPPA